MSRDQFDDVVDLPDDGSRQKEVYARFGLAAYWSQVFEVGLVNLIVVLVSHRKRTGRPLSPGQVDELYESLFAKTAGRLVRELRGALGDDPHIGLCEEAVKERNRLMHSFFRIHDRDFLTLAGKQRMVEDADRVCDVLRRADEATTVLVHDLLSRMGVGPEEVETVLQSLVEQGRREDDPGDS